MGKSWDFLNGWMDGWVDEWMYLHRKSSLVLLNFDIYVRVRTYASLTPETKINMSPRSLQASSKYSNRAAKRLTSPPKRFF